MNNIINSPGVYDINSYNSKSNNATIDLHSMFQG